MKQVVIGELGKDLSAVAVIMAGGVGTRFWPMSRKMRPKQYLPLAEEQKSLIQATSERMLPLVGKQGVLVVTAGSQAELVREQLPDASVLIEPMGKNTAACIGFAAVHVLNTVGDVPIICLPSDHRVSNVESLLGIYQRAIKIAAAEDVLVTIGIKPTSPETAYGYIKRDVAYVGKTATEGVFRVEQFVEKPNRVTAEEYVASGKYFWNSGMFIWRPTVILSALKKYLPELSAHLETIDTLLKNSGSYEEVAAAYGAIEAISIDNGVLEKTDNVLMMSGDSFQWSDIGSWNAWAEIAREGRTDDEGNFAQGDALFVGARNCAVVAGKRLVAAVGVEGLIIVDTDDSLLICDADKSQDVKKLVDLLKESEYKNLL